MLEVAGLLHHLQPHLHDLEVGEQDAHVGFGVALEPVQAGRRRLHHLQVLRQDLKNGKNLEYSIFIIQYCCYVLGYLL